MQKGMGKYEQTRRDASTCCCKDHPYTYALANFASTQLAAARMFAPTKTINHLSPSFRKNMNAKKLRSPLVPEKTKTTTRTRPWQPVPEKENPNTLEGYVGIVEKRGIIKISAPNHPLVPLNLAIIPKGTSYLVNHPIQRMPWNLIPRARLPF
jgi:hypothetical protein